MTERYNTLKQAFLSNDQEENKIITIDKDENILKTDYRTLKVYSNKVANYLLKNSISKGSRVIISMADAQTFIYTFWGVILAGAVAVPVIPPQNGYIEGKQDTTRLLKICNEISPAYILTSEEESINLQEVLEKYNYSILTISKELIISESEFVEYPEANKEDAAIILFTSGSTGTPKGVQFSNKKLLESCYQNIDYFKYTSHSSFLNWLPLQHIASLVLYHIMPTILKANQIQSATNIILSDAKKWLYYMDKYRIEASFGPNFIYGMLLEQKNDIENMNISLGHIKYIINGGEAINFNITDECVKMLKKKGFPYSSMIPGWGMTELGNGAIYSRSFGNVLYGKCVAIGKPINGLNVRITNSNEVITDEEIEGALEVKGDFIFDGYLNKDKENVKAFTKDGWFNTGDRGIWKNNEIVITGRESELFILNGVNISVNEIEEFIKSKLFECNINNLFKVTNVKNSESNNDELYMFLEDRENSNEVIKLIKEKVTEHYGFSINEIVLVPNNKFPRTSIGKIDTKLLVKNMQNNEYEFVGKKNKANFEQDENRYSDEQNLLLFIWSDVLNIDKKSISVDDDFFSLGGNSIKVPLALNRINSILNINLNAAEFVRYSTINKLLEYVHLNDENDEIIDFDDEEMIIL